MLPPDSHRKTLSRGVSQPVQPPALGVHLKESPGAKLPWKMRQMKKPPASNEEKKKTPKW